MTRAFETLDDTTQALADVGYLADPQAVMAALLSSKLERPLLVEGPAGVGKTDLARAMAEAQGRALIRLQCYEGIDESRALFEWEYGKQMLYTQLLKEKVSGLIDDAATLDEALRTLSAHGAAFFSEEFLIERPLLAALRSEEPCLLLIDEIDKADPEFEAFLLEMLSEYQVSVPELGTLRAVRIPQVVLTSNSARALSDPLKRRCLHLALDFPSQARELEIVRRHLPDIDARLAESVVAAVARLRDLDLRKRPSIGECIDWARALTLLGADVVERQHFETTLGVLLKHRNDLALAERSIDAVLGG